MKTFLKDLAERALKTAAQAFLANLTVGATMSEINWGVAFSTTAVATLISILTSIGSYSFGNSGTASAVDLDK